MLALGAEKTIFLGLSGIPLLFLASGALILAATALFAPRLREVKPVEPIGERAIAFRVLKTYQLKGIRHEIIGVWNTTRTAEERLAKIVAIK